MGTAVNNPRFLGFFCTAGRGVFATWVKVRRDRGIGRGANILRCYRPGPSLGRALGGGGLLQPKGSTKG